VTPGRRVAIAAALAWLAAACRDHPAADAPPRRVFLITVDTLRADHLPFHGYARQTAPRLADLAARAVVFERAIAQWPKTGASFASIFTGRYPQTTGLTHAAAIELPSDLVTLPEFFRRQGFTTAAVMSNPVLTRRLGWSRSFDEYLETWGSGVPSDDPSTMRPWIDALKVNALALPLLERLRDRPKLFVWIHYSDPHTPYILPAGVQNPFLDDPTYRAASAEPVPAAAAREMRLGPNRERRFYVSQYDANIGVADRAIGEVWDRLQGLGLFDDPALLVFTADHGESLGEHDSWFEHGPTPYNNTAHVPLFLLFSDRRPAERVAAPVELIDLFPTLRELVAPATEVPGLEGASLFSGGRHAFSEAGQRRKHHYRSVQEGRFKLIYDPDPDDLARRVALASAWQLYDLDADPGETANLLLAAAPADDLRRLRAALLAWAKQPPAAAGDDEAAAARDREVRKALRALGYVQ
jgi:arylsulfatase A-like enzyme